MVRRGLRLFEGKPTGQAASSLRPEAGFRVVPVPGQDLPPARIVSRVPKPAAAPARMSPPAAASVSGSGRRRPGNGLREDFPDHNHRKGQEPAPQKISRRHNTPVRCLKQDFPRDFSFQGTLTREKLAENRIFSSMNLLRRRLLQRPSRQPADHGGRNGRCCDALHGFADLPGPIPVCRPALRLRKASVQFQPLPAGTPLHPVAGLPPVGRKAAAGRRPPSGDADPGTGTYPLRFRWSPGQHCRRKAHRPPCRRNNARISSPSLPDGDTSSGVL